MLRYLIGRLLTTIPTLLLVSLSVFVLIRLVPGDPIALMLGDAADEATVRDIRAAYGLEEPLYVQCGLWLLKALSGDLGRSISNNAAVMPLILDRFQVSASIVLIAVAVAAAISVPLGMIAAWRQNRLTDILIVAGATLLLSLPSFWLGLLLLLLFGLKLGWVPVIGYVSFAEDWGAALA
ncbi:MAG: ABC transporter permease [Oceanibaculum sp.]